MTDAEKQRAYRQRRAAAIAELERELERCREQLQLEHLKNRELATEIDSLHDKISALRARK
jgi:predicted RNase H-like nuclease (RuvC/YqgF family)